MSSILNGLNEKQHEAVISPPENALILAGAGSGKTKVLVCRIAWLLEHFKMPSEAILALTFTNKAALEMKERLHLLLPHALFSMWVGTFHGICHRLLRRHYEAAGLAPQFHILDSDDQARIIKRVIMALNLDPDKWPVKAAQAFINAKKDEGLRPEHIDTSHNKATSTLVAIYKGYEKICASSDAIDFAEILLRAHELLRNNPEILESYRHRFKAILVDEFQDTNTIQYAFVRLLAGESTAVMVVGDDDQSIYGWRGACVENIQQFVDDFPNVRVVRLEQNYRSTATILQAANALIAHNDSRMGKELWTDLGVGDKITLYEAVNELDEAHFIAEQIDKSIQQGYSALNIAILYRSNAQSRVIEEALLRKGIAYRIYGGLRFFERAEVKDALAYLRLMLNPSDDIAFERVVNFPTRGIGDKTLDGLRDIAKSEDCSLWQAAHALIQKNELAARAEGALGNFIHLIIEMQEITGMMELDEQIHAVLETSGLYEHFSKIKGDKSESRLENLQELLNAAKEFRYENNAEEEADELPGLAAFLVHATLEAGEMQAMDAAGRNKDSGHVHLMTLHAAKGLEFPQVFIAGMEEGVFPSSQSLMEPKRLEEERRLCYVGLTRAKEKIFLSYAKIRRQYGREEYHKPSRFLRELPEELVDAKRKAQWAKKTNSMMPSMQEPCGFGLGQQVTHAVFGQGVIVSVEGSGAHTRVEVNFETAGRKWLVLAYAKLT